MSSAAFPLGSLNIAIPSVRYSEHVGAQAAAILQASAERVRRQYVAANGGGAQGLWRIHRGRGNPPALRNVHGELSIFYDATKFMNTRVTKPDGVVKLPQVGVGAGSLANAAGEEAFFNMVHAAWASGVRYFDTSAAYLGGESEQRLGAALTDFPRDELYVSTKLGRFLRQAGASSLPGVRNYDLDYTYDTTLKSVERSLSRLKVDRLDAVFIHDLDPAFAGAAYRDELKSAVKGAFPALQRLKEEKVIGAIGVASMDWQACLDFAELADIDVVMPAGDYSLLRTHSTALLDRCVEKRISWIAAAPFNSGILATGSRPDAYYCMRPATQSVLSQVEKLEQICKRHKVPLATAALVFPLRHPAVNTIVFGAKTADEFSESFVRLSEDLSNEFWQEMNEFLVETKNWERGD